MLYVNDTTHVIFGSDDAQDLAVCRAITLDEIPDLIANGATVDASANYAVVAPVVVGSQNVGTEVPNVQSTSTDSSSDGTQSASGLKQDAPAAPEADAPVMSSGTAEGAASATSGESTGSSLSSQSGDLSDSPSPLTGQESAQPFTSGTAVEVKQVGDSTVNTGIQQNGNVLAGQVTGNQLVNSGVTLDAPAVLVENTERDLNPLVPAAGTEGPPASQLAAQAELPEEEDMPRESHLMLMESKFAAIIAKLRNQERVAVDELEAVYAHVKAVL